MMRLTTKRRLSSSLIGCMVGCMAAITIIGCGQNELSQDKVATTSPASDDNQSASAATSVDMKSFGKVSHGEATYYHATGEGNCSFEASDNLMVAAINTKDYADAAMCGAYIRVSGPKGDVTVRIVDRCPGCGPGGLDLSREAFEKVAQLGDGRIDVSWQVVAGPVTGPVVYHYMEGTTRYWTAIQVSNHRWPIASLEIMPNGSDEWLKVERRKYNYFVRSKTIAPGPLRVRIKAVTGETLEDKLPEPASITDVAGKSQFP